MKKQQLSREQIAQRAAQEIPKGSYVNLGWGIPTLVAGFMPRDSGVFFHSENGILGMGPRARDDEIDPDLIDAMKVPVTIVPGAAFFDQAEAHLMTRGGHIDLAIMGAFQVSENGDLANWKVPGQRGPGSIGGAMDIAVGARKLIITMDHVNKTGEMKILKRCTYPLTARTCVNTIITDLAVIDVAADGLHLREVAHGYTAQEVQAVTEPKLIVPSDLPFMKVCHENLA